MKKTAPTGAVRCAIFEVAQELGERLITTFLKDKNGCRPVFGGSERFQNDPHWRNNLLFYEYFHGDNGAGVGASHQTGWTGLIARIIQVNATVTKEMLQEANMEQAAIRKAGGMQT